MTPIDKRMKTTADHHATYTFKHDVYRLKIVNSKGEHTHTAIRCQHCGALLYVPVHHKDRIECSTCGNDAERVLTLISAADPAKLHLSSATTGVSDVA